MELKQGTLLKHGEYRIEKVLGQGGFGITYMAEQIGLERKVAIKEFFMKEYCNRDEATSHVSVPSVGSKELVSKFRQKFVKEAQNIASFNHNHIIRIHDVFEENNTAYYVMEYLDCGSLSDYLSRRGRLSEEESISFIRQIADALAYIHKRKVNHLDVKPGNILLDEKNNAVLIDFGLSKHYDSGGHQTSSTPVGISKGYAPIEQYKQGGVSQFSPETDIYSLGATLYKLVTGETPPEADDINENGLSFPNNIRLSAKVKSAIVSAMQPKRKDRPQSIEKFLSILDGNSAVSDEEVEVTIIDDDQAQKPRQEPVPAPAPTPNPSPEPNPKPNKIWKVLMIVMVLIGVIGGYFVVDNIQKKKAEQERKEQERVEQERKEKEAAEQARLENERQEQALIAASKADKERSVQKDKQEYLGYIGEGDEYLSKNQYSSAINKYEIAQTYEAMYSATEYAKEFGKGSENKIKAARAAQKSYEAEQARLEQERKEQEAAEQARLEKERKEQEAAEQARLEQEHYSNTHGSISGHEWVDLGLSVKWATCNVGADSPEDYGYYFAWGETSPKIEYTEENSKTYGKSSYNRDIGGDKSLDAASANWGGSWRLPTKAECEELEDKCTWKWITQKGVRGYKVTGPNGNSIFLPAAGYRDGSSLYNAGAYGYCWSSLPNESNSSSAYILGFDGEYHLVGWSDRDYGRSVRPVSE